MSEPYRIPSCPACSRPIGEQPRACELCGQSFCASCADTGACAPCLSKACKVVQRMAGERERKRAAAVSGRMLTWIPLTLAAGMCLASVTAAYFTMQQGIALRTRQASPAALQAQNGDGDEAPPRAKRPRHHHRRHRDAAPQAPPRDETAASASEAQIPSMYSVLASLRPQTHDPEELLARAHKLQAAGLDIIVQSADLSPGLFDDDPTRALRTVHLLPLKKGDAVAGTKIGGVKPNSLLGRAGLHDGDVITSINGHEMSSPEQALSGYQEAQNGRMAVVELFRGGQRVILAIRWPEKKGAKIELWPGPAR